MSKSQIAFDLEKMQAGNRGLSVDIEEVNAQVEATLALMTIKDKFNEIRGKQLQSVEGLYLSGGNESLGIPVLKMVDGPRGARAGKATAFPVAIARAATFDVDLERRVGLAIGREVAAKGGNVLLAPCINLLRHPGWGRAQESYSEDSFLTGLMGLAFVCGAQNTVLTSPKHLAANNLEMTRFEASANMDDRTLHEVYLPHFKRCVVEGGAASIMSAYNRVNGVYCGEHQQLLTHILRNLWKFKGFVESDWILGTRSTSKAIKAGLDIEMPAPFRFTDEKLIVALDSGELEPSDLDARVKAVLFPKFAWSLNTQSEIAESTVECENHISLAREAAEKSLVLLKNVKKILPLEDRPGATYAIVGDLAKIENLGDKGSSFVRSSLVTTPFDGLVNRIKYAQWKYFASADDFDSLHAFDTVVVIVGLTFREEGEFIPDKHLEPEDDDLARGGDRAHLRLPESEVATILKAAEHAKRVVVVMEGGSAIEVRDWVDHIDGLVMAWYPGREGGHAIARILFGDVNPSGRLPVSIPRSMDQLLHWDIEALSIDHDLLHGYRYLEHHKRTPEFPFGFGLSYSDFSLSQLQLTRSESGFDILVCVENVGDCQGATVVQVYVAVQNSQVFRVPQELKAFGKVELDAGEKISLKLSISDEELRYYDTQETDWQLESCDYCFRLGFSSENPLLSDTWRLTDGQWKTALAID